MEFVIIAICVIAAMTLFGKSKSEERKMEEPNITPLDGIRSGAKAMIATVFCAVFLIIAAFLLAIMSLPNVR